jgi:hypothetical protein
MTRHRRNALKVLLLAVTAVVVSTAPLWGLPTFLYIGGALAAAVGLVAVGVLLDLFDVGGAFVRLWRWTREQARRLPGRIARWRLLHSPDVVCGDRRCWQCYGPAASEIRR